MVIKVGAALQDFPTIHDKKKGWVCKTFRMLRTKPIIHISPFVQCLISNLESNN